ncbi:MmgE/PrpD family protein [Aestuariibius insulae]|uniref:MmgE/PrpD family protein n=1 Tax=Aestuariibius insulae TaxID=2058287 RepID=UPI00345F05A6
MTTASGQGVTDQLVRFTLESTPTEAALSILRLSLFDWAVVGLAGIDEPVARQLRDLTGQERTQGRASILGGGQVSPRAAALVNGTTSHALDFDDTHFGHIGHPSAVIIPATLAVAEHTNATGTEALEAALIGAEASIRIGEWLGRAHYQAGFHQTATSGTFGAALAVARLLKLDETRTRWALGHAASRAAGLKAQFGTMAKPLQGGQAASAGVEAALMAKAGLTAHSNALETDQGFGPTHHGEANPSALEALGSLWRFETVSHKLYACCHGTHAPIEAARALSKDAPIPEAEPIKLSVHPRWLTVCNIACPQTRLEAKFSLTLTVAMALTGHDLAGLDAFEPEIIQAPNLVALRDRVEVTGDDTLSETEADLRIGTLEARHDLLTLRPLEQRQADVRAKAEALIGEAKASVLWSITSATELDLDALTAILRSPEGPRATG